MVTGITRAGGGGEGEQKQTKYIRQTTQSVCVMRSRKGFCLDILRCGPMVPVHKSFRCRCICVRSTRNLFGQGKLNQRSNERERERGMRWRLDEVRERRKQQKIWLFIWRLVNAVPRERERERRIFLLVTLLHLMSNLKWNVCSVCTVYAVACNEEHDILRWLNTIAFLSKQPAALVRQPKTVE